MIIRNWSCTACRYLVCARGCSERPEDLKLSFGIKVASSICRYSFKGTHWLLENRQLTGKTFPLFAVTELSILTSKLSNWIQSITRNWHSESNHSLILSLTASWDFCSRITCSKKTPPHILQLTVVRLHQFQLIPIRYHCHFIVPGLGLVSSLDWLTYR